MEQDTQTYTLTWQGIEIAATYTPKRWSVIDHLEIRSINPPRAPLPITQTGYRSHFMECWELEEWHGNVVEYFTTWLNEEASSPEWQSHVEATRQGELF